MKRLNMLGMAWDARQSAAVLDLRLSGPWQVQPIPLDQPFTPADLTGQWLEVPECAHLQMVLHPDQPYWGDHLREINQQAWVYRRTIRKPDGQYNRARLHFEGVDYFAEVWVDDSFVGRHEGNFDPFTFDITPHMAADEITLTVRVTAPWDAPNPGGVYPTDHVIRGLVKGLYEHGEGVIPPNVNPIGIWRPVWLLLDQGVSIDQVRIRTELDGQVDAQLHITNSTGAAWSGHLALTIAADTHDGPGTEWQGAINLPPGTHIIDQRLHIPDVRLWWPWDQGRPDLYRLDAVLSDGTATVLDAASDRFGVRTVQLERSPDRFVYRINERPVFIRGSSYIPALYQAGCDSDTLARDLSLARDANLNLLRVHVHVALPELYDLCDAAGMLIWQDFELNWIQDTSPEFEERARRLQQRMIAMLHNHPSIITWTCHNEPTMLFVRRHNLEHSPDPALFADAQEQDPTRPVFICSGQLADDWQRSGDSHTYYGALWSSCYTHIYPHRPRLTTEFGGEAPAALATLSAYPALWERVRHLEGQIEALGSQQAALIQYQVEHFRRLRAECCAGYVHFWLVDLVPQVGFGVLDAHRVPKGGYAALALASRPLQLALEHNGRRPIALWLFNDTPETYADTTVRWQVSGADGSSLEAGETRFTIAANASQRVLWIDWPVDPAACARVDLHVDAATGERLCENHYTSPFQRRRRPRGYPWKFDPFLGAKVYDRMDAPSLLDLSGTPAMRRIPLPLRQALAERLMSTRLPSRWLSFISRLADRMAEQ